MPSSESSSSVDRLRRWVFGVPDPDRFDRLPEDAPVPLIWMLGKTGSGKSSMIQYLTGTEEAIVGSGFRPETKTSRRFSFPDEDSPVVRFLDTRGLGEAGYDADADIKQFGERANLLIVTVRATDHANQGLIETLKSIRRRHPHLPTALVITSLHDVTPGQPHRSIETVQDILRSRADNHSDRSDPLFDCLRAQRDRFSGLHDRVIAVDLTKPEDGFDPCDYGGSELVEMIQSLVPAAMRQCLSTMDKLKEELQSSHAKSVQPIILAHATTAGAAAVIPLAWVDVPFVMGLQTHMAHRIAKMHGVSLDASAIAVLAPVLGLRAGMRLLIRSSIKWIPFAGSAINSAAAFTLTYATGEACHFYFSRVATGYAPTEEEIKAIYKEQLKRGSEFWRNRSLGDTTSSR